MGAEGTHLTVRVANRPDAIQVATAKVEVFCFENDVPPAAVGHLNLALDEAITNAFSYAWPEGGDHEVIVTVTFGPEGLEAEVSDDGIAFNPLEAPPPDLDADLDDRVPGGLGVHFIRTLMDVVSYRRDEERNVLTLLKRLPARGAAGRDH